MTPPVKAVAVLGDECALTVVIAAADEAAKILAGMCAPERMDLKKKKDAPPKERMAVARTTVHADSMLYAHLLAYCARNEGWDSGKPDLNKYRPFKEARDMFEKLRGYRFMDFQLRTCSCRDCAAERVKRGLPEAVE